MTTPTTVPVRLKLRQDTAANWTSVNPTLLAGELGRESDTGKIKIGNGSSTWTALAYQPFGSSITNADIAANAEIDVSKLKDGAARQLLQTAANGTDVEWASNIDIPGTLDVTGAATFDGAVTVQGDLTVNGTETIINTQTLTVEDKNIELGKIDTPTDATADGGGITLKGTTDKTINWVDATDAWTFSEHVNIASAKEYRIAGTKVLDATSLGSAVVTSSLTSVGTIGTGVWEGTAIDKTYLDATLVSTGDTGTVTSAMIANGTIVDADINASAAIVDTKLATIATAGKVSNSATTADSANTASAIVARDASGNFSAGTITAALTGAASSNVLKAGDTMTGALLHPLGTAALPSIAFTGDTNTGIFSPSADQLAVATNGTERLFIGSTGNVGIGTTSPGVPLDVNGTIRSLAGQLDLDNATQFKVLGLYHSGVRKSFVAYDNTDNVISVFGEAAGSQLVFATAGSEKARIDSSGRLLVGTSTRADGGAVVVGASGATTAATTVNLDAFGFDTRLRLTRATAGSPIGIVANNNVIGTLAFDGYDGVGYRLAASILAAVDGTPGENDMPGRLVFSTTADGASSPTERMRIDNAGNTLFTSPSNKAGIDAGSASGKYIAGSGGILVSSRATASSAEHIQFKNTNGQVGSITTDASATAYNTSSDYRLKENVVDLDGAIDRLKQLPVHRFNFIADPDTVVDGFIAHEAAEVVPECVTGTKDEVDEDGNPVYQGIDQSKIVPLLTAALQEAVAKIETLEQRLAAAGID